MEERGHNFEVRGERGTPTCIFEDCESELEIQGAGAEKRNRPSRRARFAFFVAQAPMYLSTRSILLKNVCGQTERLFAIEKTLWYTFSHARIQ